MRKEDINRLKIVLIEQKRTAKWLAEQIGRDPATVSKWCTNTVQPTLSVISNNALDVTHTTNFLSIGNAIYMYNQFLF